MSTRYANTFSTSSNKRSSSLNEYSSRGSHRPVPWQQNPNQSQALNTDESFNHLNHRSFIAETSYNSQSGARLHHLGNEASLTPHQEIDRLTWVNAELRKENKALTNKLIENSTYQQKICQLESQNKQLTKELNRKDDLLRNSSQEGSPMKHSISQRGSHTQSYVEMMTQNKILADEVSWLKRQLDGAIYEKSTADTKSYELQKLEAKLEEANSQIELLKQDLVKKNFEIEELYDKASKLKIERDQAHNRSSFVVQDQIRAIEAKKMSRLNDLEDEKARLIGSYSLEISKLREELAGTQARQEQMTRRAQIAEDDLQTLREKIANRECEYDRMRESFVNIDQEKEKEIRIREKELERIIKARTNEGIRQILQEKLQYEEKIGYLEDKIKSLETKNSEVRTKSDEEWRQMELKYRNLVEQQQEMGRRGDSFEEERLRKEVFVLNERLVETEESLKVCEREKVKAFNLLASQEKEAIKLQKELDDLGSEITIYQERMKNLEKQYQQEKEDLKRKEKGQIELLEKVEILKKRLYEQEIRGEEDRNHQRESLEKANIQLKETKEIISELNKVKVGLEEDNELLLSKATDYKRKLEESEVQLNHAVKESDKLRVMYAEAAKQLDAEKVHRGELTREYSFQKEDLKRELNQTKEKDLDLRDATVKFNAERRYYEGEIKQLRALKESAEEQVEKLYELLGQRKKECEAYLQENEQLWNETERLRYILQNSNGRNGPVEESDLKVERSKLEIERLNQGLEELNIELSRRIDELSD